MKLDKREVPRCRHRGRFLSWCSQPVSKFDPKPRCSEASGRSSRWKSCRWRYPDASVVISDGEEGDRLDRKLGSKSLWRPMGTLVRSAREASNSADRTKRANQEAPKDRVHVKRIEVEQLRVPIGCSPQSSRARPTPKSWR